MPIAFLAVIAAFFAVYSLAEAQLKWADRKRAFKQREDVILPSGGEAELPMSVLYRGVKPGHKPRMRFSPSDLYKVSDPVITPAHDAYHNYSFVVLFTGAVGVEEYSVRIGPDKLHGKFIIAGFVIKKGGRIVSGDDGEGVRFGQEGTFEFDVDAVGVKGRRVDLTSTRIEPRSSDGGVYMKEVDEKRTGFSDTGFTLAIAKLRVGRGAFLLQFEAPAIEYLGETFETVLHVTQETLPPPRCVVEGPKLFSRSGIVEARMYNVLSPPLEKNVEQIALSIGGRSIPFDVGLSILVLPTSTIAFSKTPSTGAATIVCDDTEAVVVSDGVEIEGGLTVVSNGRPLPLAKDTLIRDAPSSDTLSTLTSLLRVVDSDPDILTQFDGNDILDEYCTVVQAEKCVITAISSGSAILNIAALVKKPTRSISTLEKSFMDCVFQTSLRYACDKLKLVKVNVTSTNVIAATTGAAGLATWTILVISCVGALALIALVVLTSWAVYRRSSLLSESSYSSSGPVGVPDPSDVLYEQSIVRDVYGRSEMGGPSMRDALTSEQVASLREETLLPPSEDLSGDGRSLRDDTTVSSSYSI